MQEASTMNTEAAMCRSTPSARGGAAGRGLAFCFAIVTSLQAAAQSPAVKPVYVREVLAIRSFVARDQVDLAVDGGAVAFSLVDRQRAAEISQRDPSRYFMRSGAPSSRAGSGVFVVEVSSGAARRIGRGEGNAWSPSWSPDGKLLAFYSDQDGTAALWIWDRDQNRSRRLHDGVVRAHWGFEPPLWSPDGRSVLVKLLPERMSLDSARSLVPETGDSVGTIRSGFASRPVEYRSGDASSRGEASAAVSPDNAPSFFNAALGDLTLIDIRSGTARRVLGGVRATAARFSPNGDRLAVAVRQPFRANGDVSYGQYDLLVSDTRGGPSRVVVSRMEQEYGLAFSWSPDGQRLAFVSDGRVHVAPVDGSETRRLQTHPPFSHDYRAPIWESDSALLFAARDTLWRLDARGRATTVAAAIPGRRIVDIAAPATGGRIEHVGTRGTLRVVTADRATLRRGVALVDLRLGTARTLFEDDVAHGDLFQFDVEPGVDKMVFVAESGARPADIWMATGQDAARRLSDLHNGAIPAALGQSRVVDWTGRRGEPLRGVLLLPPDYEQGRRYPMVVKVYGGQRFSLSVNQFGIQAGVDNLQLLATRGYAVFLPDTPIRPGHSLEDITSSVSSGVDRIVAMGVADSTRMGIMGHSFGGYSVLAAIMRDQRFAAAISSGGFSNLLSHYGTLRADGSAFAADYIENDQAALGNHPWALREQYIANSPWFFLDRVKTPVLLLHGAADRTVPVARAHETFVGLRRLGKTVTLVEYPGEAHHPGSWSTENATDYWRRVFAWLDGYLGVPR